ncbi:Carbonic anhydrase 1, partial [Caligus rogercresseyi]
TVTSPHLNHDIFQFDHLHFHLGSRGKGGSEHLLTALKPRPCNKGVTDSIGVLAVLYDIIPCPNDDVYRKPEEETEVSNISLQDFLPEDVHTFFRILWLSYTPK